MRWLQRSDWGASRLRHDQWAPLEAQIAAVDIEAVEQVLEELTGFMDFFRADVTDPEGRIGPMAGVTDGQLAVVQRVVTDTWGRRVLQVTFYAAGQVGEARPDAFERLSRAAGSMVDELQADGVRIESIRWVEQPYITRPF